MTDADYGFIQLAGPDGPLFAEEVRFGLAYQGEQLHYLEPRWYTTGMWGLFYVAASLHGTY